MTRKLYLILLTFLFASWAAVSSTAVAATPKTIFVDPNGDPNKTYASIQAAIDQAAAGDTIVVSAGTYKENISFGTKKITLESESGPAKTIVIAAEKDAVVTMRGGTLRGFTLTEGSGRPASSSYGSDYYGGGIHAGNDSVIENCAIVGNGKGTPRENSGTFAGGIYAGSKSNVVVRGCLIYDNYAWACGGAVLVDHSGSLTLENCTVFNNNSTNFFGHQGGLGMANGGQLFIRNCIVWGNSGDEIGAFSGIYAKGTKATVSDSIIEGGYAGDGNPKVGGPLFKNAKNVVGIDGEYGSKDDGLRLLGNSPAINIGSENKALGVIDLAGFTRLQSTRLDAGAYEFGDTMPSGRPSPIVLPPDFTPDRNGSDYKQMWKDALAEIGALENTLADKNATIASLDKEIAGKEFELADKKNSLAKAKKLLAECQAECKALRGTLALKEAELAAKKKTVGELTAKLEKSQGGVEVLEGEITQLREDLAEAERKMLVPHTPDWHFIDGKGWLWTSPDYYPLIYSEQNAGWLYYELGTHNPWLYYDYNSESWQEW
jgi:hypothetical protein